jgi:sugar/nucleoside kinase (ribokinase family)
VIATVIGYASVDRTLHLDRLPTPGTTARVLAAAGDEASRPGGIGHFAVALVSTFDGEVVPICVVGDDEPGRAFVAALGAAGCRTDGIVTTTGRSPTTEMLHGPDGATACVFDAGVGWAELSPRGCELVAAADVVVVMIGPAEVTRTVLAGARSDAIVAWVVKNDPSALPSRLAARLRERADIIFHNAAEASLVAPLPAGRSTIVVGTDGPHPVTVTSGGRTRTFPVEPCTVPGNPTGAGDAFAGSYVAAWLGGNDEESCVAAGAAAARRRMEAPA